MERFLQKPYEEIIKSYSNIEEKIDWEKKKKYLRLDPDAEMTIEDMIQNNYIKSIQYLNITDSSMLRLAKHREMIDFLLDRLDFDEEEMDYAIQTQVVNDNLETFIPLYALRKSNINSRYNPLKLAMEYNSRRIFNYVFNDHSYSQRWSMIDSVIDTIDKDLFLRLGPIPRYITLSDRDSLYSMFKNGEEPNELLDKEYFLTSRFIEYLINIKNKYVFRIYDYFAERENEAIISLFVRHAVLNDDYILLKRLYKIYEIDLSDRLDIMMIKIYGY